MISLAAPCAEDMSGTKEKTCKMRISWSSHGRKKKKSSYVASLNGSEYRALRGTLANIDNQKTLTYHETNKELLGVELEIRHKAGSEPEHQCDDEECHGLRQRVQQVGEHRSPVGLAQRFKEAIRVHLTTVVLARKGRNSTDGGGSLACELC